LDGLVFALPDADPAFFVLGQEDVKDSLWSLQWLAPLIIFQLAILQTFGLIIFSGRSSPMMISLPLVNSA
jgi:hypothetical protein